MKKVKKKLYEVERVNGRMHWMVMDQEDCVSLSIGYCISTVLALNDQYHLYSTGTYSPFKCTFNRRMTSCDKLPIQPTPFITKLINASQSLKIGLKNVSLWVWTISLYTPFHNTLVPKDSNVLSNSFFSVKCQVRMK